MAGPGRDGPGRARRDEADGVGHDVPGRPLVRDQDEALAVLLEPERPSETNRPSIGGAAFMSTRTVVSPSALRTVTGTAADRFDPGEYASQTSYDARLGKLGLEGEGLLALARVAVMEVARADVRAR